MVSYETLREPDIAKLIGYARVSTKGQSVDRQEADLLVAGVRRDDLYLDHGVSGARATRPAFDSALGALHEGDTLVVTTLDRLGRSKRMALSPVPTPGRRTPWHSYWPSRGEHQ